MSDEQTIPTANQLRSYLRFNGWAEQAPGPSGSIWTRENSRIGVPVDSDEELLSGALKRLAFAERRDPADVASNVKYLLFDITQLRADSDSRYADTIPLETGAKIVSSARKMFRASATTARWERAHIGSNYSRYGDEIVRRALMGHTKRGSYIIPVLMPLPEPDEPDRHQPYLRQDENDHVEFHRAPSEPFERRVVRTFAQSMQALREIIVKPAQEPRSAQVHELVYRGVSREFCMALAGILGQRSVADFEAAVDWAPAVPSPTTMPRSVSIEAEAEDLVAKVAEKLRQQKVDPSQVFSGTIVQLRHESQDDPFGEIAVSTVRQGKSSEILIRLPIELYRDAWRWHDEGRAILVEGTVRRAPGKPLRVDNALRFHPVDAMFLT
ncbi:hypothetical protein GCM10010172_14930 [Paractinoplanes ferrugineus]|uniref:Uncharacterized protein n=1 Tax=Paractinoplanes ferrugineus TaxID=113564 RepID=A0A919IXK7_9ACTN|nr:hypothetical protein [Actinoplanes ferrugineus]GIE10058.1 hypothetical protein Afe05nite_18980 [Actinoplanes ferrugineus]